MDFMKPAGGDEEFERDKNKDGEEVEGRLVGKNGIAFDTFQGEDGAAVSDFGVCV